MALTSTTNPADVTNRLQVYFSKKLLEHAVNTLRLSDYAMKADLPQKASSKQIRWFRKREADDTQVQTLTEGTAISTWTEVALTAVTATLVQYGEATQISDILRLIDAYEPLQMNIATMGEDAALHADVITRNAIMTGLEDSDSTSERFAGVTGTLDSSADFTTLGGLSAENGKMTREAALGAITTLKANKTPKINGRYYAVIAPEVCHDLQQDQVFLDAFTRSDIGRLNRGELGTVDGVMYAEATNPFREDVYKTHTAAGAVFTSLFFGKDAYGCPKLAGTNSPWRPSVIINDKPDKTDPLNQYVIAGWKAFWTSVLLNSSFICALRSKTTYA